MDERIYDLIFICRPATPEEEVNKIVATLEHSTGEHGGKIEKTEKWGTRRLAYRVEKHREGFFVYMVVKSTQGDLIKELERRLKVSDAVIKYQTIRLDEELKRQQKLGKHRERRASRRPRRRRNSSKFPQQPLNKQRPANRFLKGKEIRCPISRHHPRHQKHRTLVPAPLLAQRGDTQAVPRAAPKAMEEAEEASAAKAAVPVAVDPADRAADPADRAAAASASISARRKSAVFASSTWTSSITKKSRCSSPSCRSAARSCHAG